MIDIFSNIDILNIDKSKVDIYPVSILETNSFVKLLFVYDMIHKKVILIFLVIT